MRDANVTLRRALWRTLVLALALSLSYGACHDAPTRPAKKVRAVKKPPIGKTGRSKKKPPRATKGSKTTKPPRVARKGGSSKRTRPSKTTKPKTTKPKTTKSRKKRASPTKKRRSKTLVRGKGRDDILDLLDEAAVLVLAADPHSDGGKMGTGFFVTPNIVVTNSHVVDFARNPVIQVTGAGLGKVREATLIHKTGSDEGSAGADYALLRVPGFKAKKTFILTARVERLSKVVAAGFPGVVTQSDENFYDLMKGQERSIPEVVTTEGTVNSVQDQAHGVPLVIHDATIEQGNSGGPLIDLCGRVIGINTWKIIRNENADTSQFAKSIAAKHLIKYLKRRGVKARLSKKKCKADS